MATMVSYSPYLIGTEQKSKPNTGPTPAENQHRKANRYASAHGEEREGKVMG